MKKKFCCIFPIGENVHLIKDVGMVPYMLHKKGYYDSTISFYEKEENLPYLKTEVNGLKYSRMKKMFKDEDLNIFIFLLKNLLVYDTVMMFHLNIKKVVLGVVIKFLSFGRIKVYFKLDTDESGFQVFKSRCILYRIGSFFFRKIDLFTAETKTVCTILNENSYVQAKYLPNGFLKTNAKTLEKENLIIAVGRVGVVQKDTQTFLRALSKTDLKDWKVEIIGPVEKEFQQNINSFYDQNPALREKVLFTENISNRTELEQKYAKAKVFVLTSRWEGFPLVFLEAISKGCYIVSTDLVPAKEITNNGEFGKLFPIEDDESLAQIIDSIVTDKHLLPATSDIIDFAEQNYDWSIIIDNLYNFLEKK